MRLRCKGGGGEGGGQGQSHTKYKNNRLAFQINYISRLLSISLAISSAISMHVANPSVLWGVRTQNVTDTHTHRRNTALNIRIV